MLRWHKSLKGIFLPAARLLLVAGLSGALFISGVEIFHRLRAPYRALGGAQELPQFRHGVREHLSGFVVDPDFGFRPILGSGSYTRFGTLENDYSEAKPQGITRLLFIGDSVTHRAQILEALKAAYASQPYEYWNAGVESFNTVQEVAYYRRFNRFIRPDHVILTFHLNDFETTPVAFREPDGTLVVYAPNWPVRRLNAWLFRHSYTYRHWLGLVTPRKTARSEIIEEVRANLADLQRLVAADNARLTVLVLPILRPFRDWKPDYKEYRQLILAMLQSLRIRHFDLLLPLNEALADGVIVTETGDDLFWHPSAEAAAYFAKYLRTQELLEGEDAP
ncbi:MAG TPA: hypothetical protein VEG60_27835 [Candidatus Binatia bacterium]|nr:hypothetical protein [Candidatus Binatia bacterium]